MVFPERSWLLLLVFLCLSVLSVLGVLLGCSLHRLYALVVVFVSLPVPDALVVGSLGCSVLGVGGCSASGDRSLGCTRKAFISVRLVAGVFGETCLNAF